VSEYRVLRRIFGPKGSEIIRDWGKTLSEEFSNLYPPDIKMTKLKGVTWQVM
jgi:hypothetical protein